MSAAIPLRDDFDGPALRVLTKGSRDPVQVRRFLALAEICDGGSRSDAARVGGVGLQSIRDWVLRFNAGGPAALIDAKTAGRKPKLGAAELEALVRVIEEGVTADVILPNSAD
jgi:transposase